MGGVQSLKLPDPAIDAEEAIRNLQKEVPELFFGENFQFHDPDVLEYVIQTGWDSPNLQQEKVRGILDASIYGC